MVVQALPQVRRGCGRIKCCTPHRVISSARLCGYCMYVGAVVYMKVPGVEVVADCMRYINRPGRLVTTCCFSHIFALFLSRRAAEHGKLHITPSSLNWDKPPPHGRPARVEILCAACHGSPNQATAPPSPNSNRHRTIGGPWNGAFRIYFCIHLATRGCACVLFLHT